MVSSFVYCIKSISENQGIFKGLSIVYQEMPEKFDMILSKDNPSYSNLPGIWILIGLVFGLGILPIGDSINI